MGRAYCLVCVGALSKHCPRALRGKSYSSICRPLTTCPAGFRSAVQMHHSAIIVQRQQQPSKASLRPAGWSRRRRVPGVATSVAVLILESVQMITYTNRALCNGCNHTFRPGCRLHDIEDMSRMGRPVYRSGKRWRPLSLPSAPAARCATPSTASRRTCLQCRVSTPKVCES